MSTMRRRGLRYQEAVQRVIAVGVGVRSELIRFDIQGVSTNLNAKCVVSISYSRARPLSDGSFGGKGICLAGNS
jgi:hypothetical protein